MFCEDKTNLGTHQWVTTFYLVFLAIYFKHRDGAFAVYLITRGVFPYTLGLQENGVHMKQSDFSTTLFLKREKELQVKTG